MRLEVTDTAESGKGKQVELDLGERGSRGWHRGLGSENQALCWWRWEEGRVWM